MGQFAKVVYSVQLIRVFTQGKSNEVKKQEIKNSCTEKNILKELALVL